MPFPLRAPSGSDCENIEIRYIWWLLTTVMGYPKALVDQVFQPSFTTKQHRGTGLGLSISKKVAARHRGEIRLRSSVRRPRAAQYLRSPCPPNAEARILLRIPTRATARHLNSSDPDVSVIFL
jgi:hypothetical protein